MNPRGSWSCMNPFLRQLRHKSQKRCLSYSDTVTNLRINSETRLIFQGFTGKQATFDAKQSLEYGTKIVGGVRPGKDGEHLGLPVLPSVKAVSSISRILDRKQKGMLNEGQAVEQLKPDATAVYVAAPGAAAAIEEAIEAQVPLIVAVAEFIPLHDMLRVQQILRTQSKSRLVGPNCPGMINPHAKCRIGFPPIPFFKPGSVGIVSKSGTLSYETVASTTRAGVGQSMVIGIGGDPLPGTTFVDALKIFEYDENTKGIIIVGEIGGRAELEAAEWIKGYRQRTADPKPIMTLVAGIQAPFGIVMGHAGACFREQYEEALTKIARFEEAGAVVTDHPEKFGNAMKTLLAKGTTIIDSKRDSSKLLDGQRRRLHTSSSLLRSRPQLIAQQQKRNYRVPAKHLNSAMKLLRTKYPGNRVSIEFFVDRSSYGPCIRCSWASGQTGLDLGVEDAEPAPPEGGGMVFQRTYTYGAGEVAFKDAIRDDIFEIFFGGAHSPLRNSRGETKVENLADTLWTFACAFEKNEVSHLKVDLVYEGGRESWIVLWADAEFDDSAFKSSKRQERLYQLRDTSAANAAALEGEKYGIVYVRLPGDANVATIVNGAGLAMNTVDALTNIGAAPTNFLDTGGKATSETVSQSFRTVLTDPRVKAIFVNIFGGLTLCDMIARGVIQAYQEVGIEVPVVVRLRGTNEKEGQKLIAESGLPIEAFDEFEEAAKRVKHLANQGQRMG